MTANMQTPNSYHLANGTHGYVDFERPVPLSNMADPYALQSQRRALLMFSY